MGAQRRVSSLLAATALSLGGGALWGLCHGKETWWLLSWVALIPLLSLAGRPTGLQTFLFGWLHGVVAWVVGIPWITYALGVYGQLPDLLSALLLLALAAYLGLYQAAFVWLGRGLWRAGGVWPLLGLPALWVGLETLRGLLFGGFPWNLAAYAWTEVPGALPLAAWGGAFGVSFLLLWANTGLALGLRRRSWRSAAAGVLLPVVFLGLGVGGAGRERTPPEAAPYRIVQPNISMVQRADWDAIEAGYRRLLELSRQACDEPGALLLWPESGGWPLQLEGDPYFPGRLRRDLQELAGNGCPILFNSVHEEPQGLYNSAFLLTPEGRLERYDKRHLVPWGEFVPLGEIFPTVGKLARNAGSFLAGKETRNLGWRGEKLGLGVCYESIFPFEVAETVRDGATLLATVSNDAWYGESAARKQLFRAVRFRAAENRRPLLRAAITGISAAISADGGVEKSLDLDQVGVLEGRVAGRGDLTVFTRWPGWVPWGSLLLAAFAIITVRRKGS